MDGVAAAGEEGAGEEDIDCCKPRVLGASHGVRLDVDELTERPNAQCRNHHAEGRRQRKGQALGLFFYFRSSCRFS